MWGGGSKGVRSTLKTSAGTVAYYPLAAISEQIAVGLERLPFTVKLLLENLVRQAGTAPFTWEEVGKLAQWQPGQESRGEFPFLPARVLLQDLTGVPVLVDLAAMRDAVRQMRGDPRRVNPISGTCECRQRFLYFPKSHADFGQRWVVAFSSRA